MFLGPQSAPRRLHQHTCRPSLVPGFLDAQQTAREAHLRCRISFVAVDSVCTGASARLRPPGLPPIVFMLLYSRHVRGMEAVIPAVRIRWCRAIQVAKNAASRPRCCLKKLRSCVHIWTE